MPHKFFYHGKIKSKKEGKYSIYKRGLFYYLYHQTLLNEYEEPSFLAIVQFGSAFPHLSRQQVISLSQSSFVSPVQLTDGTGGRGRARSQII